QGIPAAAIPGQPQPVQTASIQPLDPLVHAPVVRPFEMPQAYQPMAPMPYAPAPAVTPASAVSVGHYHGSYEGAAAEQQRYYQAGVESHFRLEQSMMGALDGEWTVTGQDGGALFTVILNDVGAAAPLEGAWRDLRAGHGASLGVLDTISRERTTLKISFHSGGGDRLEPTVLTLAPQPD